MHLKPNSISSIPLLLGNCYKTYAAKGREREDIDREDSWVLPSDKHEISTAATNGQQTLHNAPSVDDSCFICCHSNKRMLCTINYTAIVFLQPPLPELPFFVFAADVFIGTICYTLLADFIISR